VNDEPACLPTAVRILREHSAAIGFPASCEDRAGALLRTLAATKPAGLLLEIGTGTGVGTAWLLDGMSHDARLVTIERDPDLAALARDLLGVDPRVEFATADANDWVAAYAGPPFDLVFADCRVGKLERRDEVLRLLRRGGIYVADDLRTKPFWAGGYQSRVDRFLAEIATQPCLQVAVMDWASGLIVAARS